MMSSSKGNEYMKGNIVGIVQTVVGFPFDSYKIYKQTQNTLSKTIINFKGLKYPLFSNVISNSLFFGNCEQIKDDFKYGIKIGFLSGLLINPFEVLKIRAQLDVVIIHQHKGLWKGLLTTTLREMIAVPIYFQSYNFFKTSYNLPVWLAGGLAGMSSWMAVFPIDTYKSCLQSGSLFYFKNCFSGMGITLLRAFIVNSIGFWIYEK